MSLVAPHARSARCLAPSSFVAISESVFYAGRYGTNISPFRGAYDNNHPWVNVPEFVFKKSLTVCVSLFFLPAVGECEARDASEDPD